METYQERADREERRAAELDRKTRVREAVELGTAMRTLADYDFLVECGTIFGMCVFERATGKPIPFDRRLLGSLHAFDWNYSLTLMPPVLPATDPREPRLRYILARCQLEAGYEQSIAFALLCKTGYEAEQWPAGPTTGGADE